MLSGPPAVYLHEGLTVTRWCQCDRCDKAGPYKAGDCRLCWLFHNNAEYRRHWADAPSVSPRPQPAGRIGRTVGRSQPVLPPCRWEGGVVAWCPRGDENRHQRQCLNDASEFDTCKRSDECRRCPLWEEVTPETPPEPFVDTWTRHLMFHVYPVSGNGAWQRNVSRLVERLRLFNGKIIVAIVVDPPGGRKPDPTGPNAPDRARHFAKCDSPETVKAAFGEWRDRIEFMVFENDPHLREGVSFIPMLERLPNEPGHAALYAQAKGTTRHPGHIAHHWADVQWIVNCDYWPLVAEQLAKFPVTGCFKKLGKGWKPEQSKSDWHYSGSFFWLRLADLFQRDWRRMDQFWSTIEPYPSQQFNCAEAGCLFWEAKVPQMNLYRQTYWRQTVDPALARWRRDNAKYFNGANSI